MNTEHMVAKGEHTYLHMLLAEALQLVQLLLHLLLVVRH